MARCLMFPIEFNANHPFIIVLTMGNSNDENNRKLPLFTGRVTNFI